MKKLMFTISLVAIFAGCAKDNNSSNTTTTTAAHSYGTLNGGCYDYTAATYVATSYCSTTSSSTGYTYSNGYCYSTSTGQQVANSYCGTTTSSAGYTYSNGMCYSTSTWQPVATSYCTGSSSTNSGQCYGTYAYTGNGYIQYVTCAGTNCRGYNLIQVSTGTVVYCQ